MNTDKKISRRLFIGLASGLALALAPGGIIEALRSLFKKLHPLSMPKVPGGIVVHHSAAKPHRQRFENAETIDIAHKKRGLGILYKGRVYNIAYHYVILPDGTIEAGRPEKCKGGHTRSAKHNRWIGICLVGYFDPRWRDFRYHKPTPGQMDSLVDLSRELMDRYGFGAKNILGHCQVNPTLCPGRSFPMHEYIARVKNKDIEDVISLAPRPVYMAGHWPAMVSEHRKTAPI